MDLTIGERMNFIGINLPTISIAPPRYIMISTNNPKINVEIGESIEKPLNENCVIKIVAEIANTEGSNPFMNLLFIFADSFGIASIISDEIITPRVAKAESHSEISQMEYGVVMQIKETAMNREVTGSLSR